MRGIPVHPGYRAEVRAVTLNWGTVSALNIVLWLIVFIGFLIADRHLNR